MVIFCHVLGRYFESLFIHFVNEHLTDIER